MRANKAFHRIFMSEEPYEVSERATRPFAVPTAPSEPWRGVDVLAVSDNPTLAVYLSSLFREAAWKVVCKPTAAESIRFLGGHRVAVAVCEQNLPDGSWRDLAGALDAIPEAPALIVIGDDDFVASEALAAGSFDVLDRPLKESDALWTIASAWHEWMSRYETTRQRTHHHRAPLVRGLR